MESALSAASPCDVSVCDVSVCDVSVPLCLCGSITSSLPSVVHSVGKPVAALAIAVDAVEPAAGEFDVPVVAFDGALVPPAVFEGPGAGRDPDETLDPGGRSRLGGD